jgi:hypothetical protein
MATAKSINPNAQLDFAFQVKTALLRRKLTVTQLAKVLGYARNTVSIAVNHPSMMPGVKVSIRKHLRLPVGSH